MVVVVVVVVAVLDGGGRGGGGAAVAATLGCGEVVAVVHMLLSQWSGGPGEQMIMLLSYSRAAAATDWTYCLIQTLAPRQALPARDRNSSVLQALV